MIQKLLSILWLAAMGLFAAAWAQKGEFPRREEFLPALREAPRQVPLSQDPFLLPYMGKTYRIEPMAEYALSGLIVSHNNIHGIADIFHDESSLDTKDICVVWGGNLDQDLNRIKFWSGDWTCYWQYKEGDYVQNAEISNNHLITDRQDVRDAIHNLRIGDQISLKGRLVTYRDVATPDFARASSLSRTDEGNGACEVLFVEEVQVLAPGTPGWYKVWRAAGIALWAAPVAKALLALLVA